MKKYAIIILAFLVALQSAAALAYTPKTVPNPKSAVSDGFVSNPDGILSASTVASVNSVCGRLRSDYNVEMAVVAVQSIDGAVAADFAQELFMLWGIGGRDKNQGLLVLLAVESRDLRIHTGGGMEGILPDAVCTRIFRNVMRPDLSEGNWDAGILKGVEAIEKYISDPEASAELIDPAFSRDDETSFLYGYLVFVILLSMAFVIWMYKVSSWNPSASNNVRYANGYSLQTMLWVFSVFAPIPVLLLALWFKRIRRNMRRKVIQCPQCGRKMKLLSESEEDSYLSPARQAEERVGSVDYDVWHCDGCGNNIILDYRNHLTKYTKCPACGAQTYTLLSDVVIRSATTLRTGIGEKSYICKHCNHFEKRQYTIPRVVVVTSGSGGRSGGGFSGGSWGGGISFGGGGGGRF